MADAASEVDDLPPEQLPALVDRLAEAAGEYFASITALAGAGYKLEMNLARFYQRHVRPTLGGSHLPLLAGIEAPAGPAVHAVTSLDWWYPPLGEVAVARADGEYGRLVESEKRPRQLPRRRWPDRRSGCASSANSSPTVSTSSRSARSRPPN